jgi:hypothetical protein
LGGCEDGELRVEDGPIMSNRGQIFSN